MDETERARLAMDLSRQAHPWPSFIGQMVGGFIAVLVLSILFEKLIFQRVMDDPVKGKLGSVIAAWLAAGAIGGFGMADGGPYQWFAFVIYAFPAMGLACLAHRRGVKLRDEADTLD